VAGAHEYILSPLQITSLLTFPHPSAFRVAQLTHVRRHARSKGTGYGDKSPTQAPGRFKNIRARRNALWDEHPCGTRLDRQRRTELLLHGANQISYQGHQFAFPPLFSAVSYLLFADRGKLLRALPVGTRR